MDPRRAPERVGKAHVADQLTYLKRHGRPSAARPRLPAPVRSESDTVPTDHGVRFDNRQRRSNIGGTVDRGENQSVGPAEGRPLWPCPPQNIDLLAQHQILSFKRPTSTGIGRPAPTRSVCKHPSSRTASTDSRSLATG